MAADRDTRLRYSCKACITFSVTGATGQEVGSREFCGRSSSRLPPPAQYEYGLSLVHGVGVPADVLKGMHLIHAAAAAGSEAAQEFVRAEGGDASVWMATIGKGGGDLTPS